VGVLALQGDFAAHIDLLAGIGAEPGKLRRPEELEELDGVIIPGGETTTLHRLLRSTGLLEPLREFCDGHRMLGTCAGAILMAGELEDAGGVEPLGLIDMTVRRNGFGRQVDSFEGELALTCELGDGPPPIGDFIRAPRILRVGPSVEVLAVHGQEPVAVRQGLHVALTFHPEIHGDARWHRYWLRDLL
jgi:5'-phosphate synthase pdxT subunit